MTVRSSTTARGERRPRSAGHLKAVGDPKPLRKAILIASKDGEATIARTVTSALSQAPVFVVSDGSSDATAAAAREAGATVLELTTNVGKPTALHKAVHEMGLLDDYDIISILDDDTTIAPDFMAVAERYFRDDPGTAIVVGKTITDWQRAQRWNPWVAARAYSYWRYQVTIRPGQDAFNALNCISGSNSVYRTSLLREVLVEQTPYIVDDTYWVLEAHRRELGRVRYAPEAVAYIQDPTNFRDWYKQNLRWLWGTCQGIIGHRVLRRRSWFDFWYATLILDWIIYVLLWPVLLVVALSAGWMRPEFLIGAILAGYTLWVALSAIALRKWRLIFMIPFIIFFDWLYRVNFAHAAIKAIREPTVESCRWESPTRYQEEQGVA